MPIKFKVNVEHFAQAMCEKSMPAGPGDIVFAWDEDSDILVVGVHLGFKNTFDTDTGKRTTHKPRVFVISWTDPAEMSFDHCVRYPMKLRPMVVTPKGTGVIDYIDGDKIVVQYYPGCSDTFYESEVKLFDWETICNAQKN